MQIALFSKGSIRTAILGVLVLAANATDAQVTNFGKLSIFSSGNLSINGSFVNTGSGTDIVNNGNLQLTGDFTNNGNDLDAAGTGTVIFSGTAAQNINGTQPTTFYNLTKTNANDVIITRNQVINNALTLTAGRLLLNNNTLTLNGAVTHVAGSIAGTPVSGLVLNGAAAKNLYFTPGYHTLKNVVVGTSATNVSLDDSLYLASGTGYGTLTVDGKLNSNGYLTLKSDANGTARVAASLGTITGNARVERYISARRAFRLLTPSVYNTGSIKANWMEGVSNPDINTFVDPSPGYGVQITGANPVANGFDPTNTNNPSLFSYTNSSWSTPLNTNASLASQPGQPWRILVRGNRSTDMRSNNPLPNTSTVLRASGSLFTGTLSYSSSGANPLLNSTSNAFSFVGNPYASPVNWNNLIKTNVLNTYTAWDPNIGVRGAYVTYDGSLDVTSNYASEVNAFIQSGQAFFVRTIGNDPSLQFMESSKGPDHTHVFRTPSNMTKLSVLLLLNTSGGTNNTADGVVAVFDNSFSAAIGNEDSYKFTNQDENMAINCNGTALSIEGRPPVQQNDTLFLKMWQFRQSSYYLRINATGFDPAISALVKDAYLKTEVPVGLSSVTDIPFTITNDSASFASNRFMIVFNKSGVLPVAVTDLVAYKKDKGVQLDWIARTESNIDSYEVEKSGSGKDFKKVSVVKAKGNNVSKENYSWYDEKPFDGNNYYRLRIMDKTGTQTYSPIVSVKIDGSKSSFAIYPNPVVNRVMRLQFNNQPKGAYSIQLFDAAGKQMMTKKVEYAGGSEMLTIQLPVIVSQGVYQLKISNEDRVTVQKVICE